MQEFKGFKSNTSKNEIKKEQSGALEGANLMASLPEIIGNCKHFLAEEVGEKYANKFSWIFTGAVGALASDDIETFKKRFGEKEFIEILKNNNIQKVAEVGPGTSLSSMILPLKKVFKEAGCEMSVIGNDLDISKNDFSKNEISVIDDSAGGLGDRKLNFDLVVAHNVFSFGGQITAGYEDIDSKIIIKRVTDGVLDMIENLSENKNATIVLTEQYDVMPIDKEAIARKVEILAWHQWPSGDAWMYAEHDSEDPDIRRITAEAPNFIVLQKKLEK